MTTILPKQPGRKALHLIRPEEIPTLEDAIGVIRENSELRPSRRRDLVSALRRVAAACSLSPREAVADTEWLRQRLAAQPAVRLGRSPKTRANVLSNAVAALACSGLTSRRPRVQLSPAWQCLWSYLDATTRIALGSFMKFCSYHQVQPEEVTDDTLEAFRELMTLSSLRKKPEEAMRELTVRWNRCVGSVPGWPLQSLSVPERRKRIALPAGDLPPSFIADLDRYLARLTSTDIFDVQSCRPLAAVTVAHRRGQILRFVGELVAVGVQAARIPDLRTIVDPDMAYRGLQAMLDRKGEPSGMIHGVAYALLAIAKHYTGSSEDDLARLRLACARLKPKRHGMTPKNRARLRQFDDAQNLTRILTLPQELLHEAKTKSLAPRRAAALVEVALAIELLLMTALRVKNLASLHLDENIQWSRSSKRGVCHLVVDGRQVKNGENIDVELEGETVALLRTFLDRHRHNLAPATSRWLFSRQDGMGSVSPIVLARRISETIRKRTGLAVNVHLFRALGAKIYLDQHPGGYEVVRRTLGHKQLSTTTAAYTGMEIVSAAKHFDQTIRQRRALSKRGCGPSTRNER
jgi:integrase